jgi:hypothetical protein
MQRAQLSARPLGSSVSLLDRTAAIQTENGTTYIAACFVLQLLHGEGSSDGQAWLEQAWQPAAHQQPIAAFLTSLKVSSCNLHACCVYLNCPPGSPVAQH